jgi:hypothetical protein
MVPICTNSSTQKLSTTQEITQQRLGLGSPTTSSVSPVKRCMEGIGLLVTEDMGDRPVAIPSGLLLRFCDLCFLRSARVPAFIVTDT